MAIVTKTYISKSNTIFKDSCVNNGLNPIMSLGYGWQISRGLIYFDHTKVKQMVEDKTYPDVSKLHHVLKMTNTASLSPDIIHKPCADLMYDDYKERATSFDLIFFLVNKPWDGGKGFDYVKDLYKGDNRAFSNEGSNWYQYRNYVKWDEDGIYNANTLSLEIDKFKVNKSNIVIGYQHFDYGNENIEIDITDIFNKFILEEVDNYGIGIAFSPYYENLKTDKTQYIGFFTQQTHSFFEPFVETTYDDTIEDDRIDFYLNKDNKLYFYSSVGGNRINLDELPVCTVNGQTYEVKQATKGAYYIDINISDGECEPNTMLYDVWSNLKYNGKDINDVELSFVTKEADGYFSFGLPNHSQNTEFVPSVYGIDQMETIKRGDVRKVTIECRIPYTTNQLANVDNIQYRLYVLISSKEYDVIGWTKTERAYNENYFLINTNELLPGKYYVDIKTHNNMNETIHSKKLTFDIANDATNERV